MNTRYIDSTSLIRPPRIAFIINLNEINYKWVINYLIPFLCSHWHGRNMFILPIADTSNLYNNYQIQYWLSLLNKYDPDKIISTTNTSRQFQNQLLSHILTKDFFEYAPSVKKPSLGMVGGHGLVPIDKIEYLVKRPIVDLMIMLHLLIHFMIYGFLQTMANTVILE